MKEGEKGYVRVCFYLAVYMDGGNSQTYINEEERAGNLYF